MDLTGKVAIVTGNGNGRGLGFAIAHALNVAGAMVPLSTRRTLDVTSPVSIHAFVANILEEAGRIDILVNNAAILGPVGTVDAADSDDVDETILTNLIGPMLLMGAVIPHMRATGGKIINIAGGGATDPLPRRAVYAASKAGLLRATESIAAELEADHIDVNAVLPGPLPTAMHNDIIDAGPVSLGSAEYAEHATRIFDGTELDRAARLCVYLASSESDGISGRTISARHDPWPFDAATKAAIIADKNAYTLRRINEVQRDPSP